MVLRQRRHLVGGRRHTRPDDGRERHPGTLRFANGAGDYVIFILGVHNYHPYTDIAANLKPGDTGMLLHPSWYGSGERAHTRDWSQARGTEASDSKGHRFSVVVSGEGKDYKADIYIQ